MESREQQESGFVGGVTIGLPVVTGCCGESGTDADGGCCGEPGARVDAAGLDAQPGSTLALQGVDAVASPCSSQRPRQEFAREWPASAVEGRCTYRRGSRPAPRLLWLRHVSNVLDTLDECASPDAAFRGDGTGTWGCLTPHTVKLDSADLKHA